MPVEIIKFGKYKNQPVEVLKQDIQYVKWLQTQEWFRSNHQNINNIIINNFSAPSETPEHNKIQALFLNYSFCNKLLNYLLLNNMIKSTYSKEVVVKKEVKINHLDEDKPNRITLKPSKSYITELETVEVPFEYEFRGVYFELNGIDVMLNYNYATFNIEIKPNLSDDYPAVLRQMQSSKSNILLCESYDGIGATFDQVKDIFYKSGRIRVIKISDFS